MAQHGIKTFKEGNWELSQFSGAPTVVIAERRLKWYDYDRLQEIREHLYESKCRVFFEDSEDNPQYANKRKYTKVEVYKRYRDQNFKENAMELLRQLEELFEE
jgi:hypothetical protein